MSVNQPPGPTCPPGFSYYYSVQPGDTMYRIAQHFGISLQQLIAANPDVSDPGRIYPGQVLCVPTSLHFPCCVTLGRQIAPPALSPDAQGTALIQALTNNRHSVSVLAVRLPSPGSFGNFDIYQGTVNVPNAGGFGFRLFQAQDTPAVWAGTIEMPTVLTPDSTVFIRPENTRLGDTGRIVLLSDLKGCVR